MKNIILYTDGACSGNPGPGGWGAVLIYGQVKKEIADYEAHTTNQKMEMQAAIEGLKALKEPCKVDLYSDSAYLINGFNKGWLKKWVQNGWQTAKKKPVENKHLWQELLELDKKHQITWHKVLGHSDDELNNRCDELAKAAVVAKGVPAGILNNN